MPQRVSVSGLPPGLLREVYSALFADADPLPDPVITRGMMRPFAPIGLDEVENDISDQEFAGKGLREKENIAVGDVD